MFIDKNLLIMRINLFTLPNDRDYYPKFWNDWYELCYTKLNQRGKDESYGKT